MGARVLADSFNAGLLMHEGELLPPLVVVGASSPEVPCGLQSSWGEHVNGLAAGSMEKAVVGSRSTSGTMDEIEDEPFDDNHDIALHVSEI